MLKSRFNLTFNYNDTETHLGSIEKEIEGEEPKKVYRCLNKSEVSIRLSFLGKTADGDGYTYLKADLSGMDLISIQAITCYKHLQFLDVSMNHLRLNELQVISELPYLVLIQADKNKLESAALRKMQYLQVMIMNNNDITTVQDIFQPELSTLEMGFNKIQKIYFDKTMPNMKCLDFRNNQICDITDIDFPKLDSLYLANNNIESLVGLEKLVNLRILHVRDNPIRVLDGFHKNHTKLIYVNLRNCEVASIKQVKILQVLKKLQTLILKGCPYMGLEDHDNSADYEDDPETRIQILSVLPNLIRINKDLVGPDERNEAKALMLLDL